MVRFSFSILTSATVLVNLAVSVVASPMNTETYRELTDGNGNTGSCRGNGGGADRVDSRYTLLNTQLECETVCDGDDGCVAYAYSDVSGDCIIYGPGQDGTCSLAESASDPSRYHNFQSCGDCVIDGVDMPDYLVKNLCGSCSKDIPSGLVNSASICSTVDGVWSTGMWTAGSWEGAKAPWAGESYTHATILGSTNVHTISVAGGFHCYDKMHSDGQPTCMGTYGDDGMSCQTAFENLRVEAGCIEGCVFYPRNGSHSPYCDGIPSDGEKSCIEEFEGASSFSESSCTSINTACSYEEAPAWSAPPIAIHAPPEDLGLGWQAEPIKATESSGDCTGVNIAQCEGKDNIAGFAYGVCRADQAFLPNGAHLNQKWCANCINTNGDQVNLDERACAQTCLDEPSGGCVAFSHADGGNCIIYGIDVDQYLYNPGDVENQWGGWTHKHEPCIGPKFPIGCEQINTIKPNQKFLCRMLETDSSRWLAWGDASGSETIQVELIVDTVHGGSISPNDFTDDMKAKLQEKMATVAFVNPEKDVSVDVQDGDIEGTTKVVFSINSSSAAVVPMTGMLDTVLVSKTRDGSFYFYSETTGGSSNKNSGVMVPSNGKIAGIIVHGMRHHPVDKSKEEYVRGWSDAHDFQPCARDEVVEEVKPEKEEVGEQESVEPVNEPPASEVEDDLSDAGRSGSINLIAYYTSAVVALMMFI